MGTYVKPSWLPRHAELKDALSRVKYNSNIGIKLQYNKIPGKLCRLLGTLVSPPAAGSSPVPQQGQGSGGVSRGVGQPAAA